MKFKTLTIFVLATLGVALIAAEKGTTIVVKKDERRIAGLNTNGITRWTANVGQDGYEVTAVNQSGGGRGGGGQGEGGGDGGEGGVWRWMESA